MIIVEDGTSLDNANSYVSISDIDNELGEDWRLNLTVEEQEKHIITACRYLDYRWTGKIKGRPVTSAQALEFPRIGLTDAYGNIVESVPYDIKLAQIFYVEESIKSGLYTSSEQQVSSDIKHEKVSVGPITKETEYRDGVAQSTSEFKNVTTADIFIKPYLKNTNGLGVIRA